MADENAEVVVEKDALTLAQEQIAKVTEERDNYKAVALKRLGKLPGDAELLDKDGDGTLSVEEQVRIALLDREVESALRAKDDAAAKIIKENAELRLALKNQPGNGIGGDSGAGNEVKDNVFSPAQLEKLRQDAVRIGADPEKFIERMKENLQKRS